MSIANGGKVYLVGAGPGNPNLLTKQAERLIREADIILYDRLVNPLILQYASEKAVFVNVGKKPYHKHIQQVQINHKMIAAAHQYKHVVRLKGGDPAIFGRVYEELEALKQQAIEVEIVPGITSASAAAATMNVGLTMRQVAPSVTFSTGHFKDDVSNETDIRNLHNGGTLAIYMGVKCLGHIIQQITAVSTEDYPIAVIFNASWYNETTVIGRLSTIEAQLTKINLEGQPGICLVGPIVEHMSQIPKANSRDSILKILVGEKEQALIQAEHLADIGTPCLIQPSKTAHQSQHDLFQHIIAQHQCDYIYME